MKSLKHQWSVNKFRIIFIIFLIILIISIIVYKFKENFTNITEHFEELPLVYTGTGFGFEETPNERPLFLNFYPTNLGVDFNLQNTLRKLRFLNKNNPTITNGSQNGYFSNNGQVNIGQKLAPIVLIPGIGSSKISARWNKKDTKTVKVDDASKNFDTTEKWSCKQSEPEWTSVWFNNTNNKNDKLSEVCWADNIKVSYDSSSNSVINSEGVSTIVPDMGSLTFESDELNILIKALNSSGYVASETLFGASYDFRTIANKSAIEAYKSSLMSMIENAVYANGSRAILISHDLGSVIINYILVNMSKQWKDKFIECSIMMAPVIGGLPKALRTLLSGSGQGQGQGSDVIRDLCRNFTGLQLMLPLDVIYGERPLVNYRQISYNASDIPKLMDLVSLNKEIYHNLVKPFQMSSIMAPHVAVYTLAGLNLDTESNYNYTDTLIDNPNKRDPYYKSNLPYETDKTYQEMYNGDGTVPKFISEYSKSWSGIQQEPVNFKFYNKAEHVKILAMSEPITDLLEIIQGYNNR